MLILFTPGKSRRTPYKKNYAVCACSFRIKKDLTHTVKVIVRYGCSARSHYYTSSYTRSAVCLMFFAFASNKPVSVALWITKQRFPLHKEKDLHFVGLFLWWALRGSDPSLCSTLPGSGRLSPLGSPFEPLKLPYNKNRPTLQ